MTREFARSGIRFQYPADWKIEIEATDDGWSATVTSPETAFAMVVHHRDVEDPAELADLALETMRENYPDLESETTVETLADLPAIGHDIAFIALDLTNTCWIRALTAPVGSVLIICQCSDEELIENGAVMKAICASLSFQDEPE